MVRPIRRFAPLQPSNLRFLSGPSSPASPISPIAARPRFSVPQNARSQSLSSSNSSSDVDLIDRQPMEPMPWLWCCHVCSSNFPLGTTRRCLNDGHHFCGGTSYDRRTGRLRRHRSCQSEFDYRSWGQWGKWRREESTDSLVFKGRKDCGKHCDYPSECRFTKKRELEAKRSRVAGYASLETLSAAAALSSDESVSRAPITIAAAPTADPIPLPTRTTSPQKSSIYALERLMKDTKKLHSTGSWTSLSPIFEEPSARSSPATTPPSNHTLPALEFSDFPISLKDFQAPSFLEEEHAPSDPAKALDALTQDIMDFDYDADVDTSTSTGEGSPVSPLSPSPQETIPPMLSLQNYVDAQKRFGRREKKTEVAMKERRSNALPGGSIGGALTPPSTPKLVRRSRS